MTDPLFTSNPNVCCGDPCVPGTRITERALREFWRDGRSPEETQREYPSLSVEYLRLVFDTFDAERRARIAEILTAAQDKDLGF